MNWNLLIKCLGIELSEVSAKEKFVSGLGGFVSILVTVYLCTRLLHGSAAVCVIASMGASAVLLFALPHGQLSQPWPAVGGHGVSALLGVICAKYIPSQELASACAVALAIMAMHQLKCIHPPGGATALTAVLGSAEVHDLGYRFVLFPVVLNTLAMVAVAVLFNACFAWRRYPSFLNQQHVAANALTGPSAPLHTDIVKALREIDSFVDISEEDLVRLVGILSPRHPSEVPLKPRPGGQASAERRN